MPYIKKEDRAKFESTIYTLLADLKENNFNEGEINYVFSSVIWRIFDSKPSYSAGNRLVGVLECVKQEFIRRRLNSYEDSKIAENGDI